MLKLNSQVRLTPLEIAHADAMFRWMSDPEVADNVGLRRKPSPELTREWIHKAHSDPSILAFAVLFAERHVGNVILDQIDEHLGAARLSIYIGEPGLRGKGVGSTATYLAVREGFENHHLNKVWLTVHVRNSLAVNAYGKLGFALEGVLRQEFWLNGNRTDVFRMSLLQREFRELTLSENSHG